jgi:hypothetical protein
MALIGGLLAPCFAQESPQSGDSAPAGQVEEQGDYENLEDLNRKMENPLSKVWALAVQDNVKLQQGDAVEGTHTGNTLFFQPLLPVPIGNAVFSARPVFPLVTSTVLDPTEPNGVKSSMTGFGDIQMMTLLGPDVASGFIWGGGPTFKFPTASRPETGQGKYQAGPAALLMYSVKPWTAGTIVQHWWSFAGDDQRAETSLTEILYFLRRQVPGAMSLGLGPTITIDWKAPAGEKVDFPVGFGIVKLVRLGKVPTKLKAEVFYSVIRPESFGTAWSFRFQATPVINSPFP